MHKALRKRFVPAAVGGFIGFVLLLFWGDRLNDYPTPRVVALALFHVAAGAVFASVALPAMVADRRKGTSRTTATQTLGTQPNVTGTSSVSLTGSTGGTESVGPTKPFKLECQAQSYAPTHILRPADEDAFATEALVTVLEDLYTRKSPREIVPRILKDVANRAPMKTDDRYKLSDGRFKLSAFRSEGPVTVEGVCAAGWTFYFVREDDRLGCVATVTDREVSLQYGSTTDVEIPYVDDGTDAVPDVAAAVRAVCSSTPECGKFDLYVRATLPDAVFVYVRDPVVIADVAVGPDTVSIRNVDSFQKRLLQYEARHLDCDRWSVDDVLQWFRQSTTPNDSLHAFLSAEGAKVGFVHGEKIVFRRLGRGLYAVHGASALRELEQALAVALKSDVVAEALFIVRLIAYIPSGASTARLHNLANTADDRLRKLAGQLFQSRRHRELGVRFDPIEAMNFKELREAMGKDTLRTVALQARGYNVRSSILERLASIRLMTTRIRVVTGGRSNRRGLQAPSVLESGLITGAYMRVPQGDTEAFLAVMPAPVPAYVLHIAGSAADTFKERIERVGLLYTEAMLLQDLAQFDRMHLSSFHRAVVYLSMWDPENPPPDRSATLIEAYHAHAKVWQLRAAIVEALEHAPKMGDAPDSDPLATTVDAFLRQASERLESATAEQDLRLRAVLARVLIQRGVDRVSLSQSVMSMPGAQETLRAADLELDSSATRPMPLVREEGPPK